MNYFLLANEDLFEQINYNIDTLSQLKEDLVKRLNDINNKPINSIEYDCEKNEISQDVNQKKIILGVDYIGPSRYHAKCRGIKDDIIIAFSYATRELGGHMLFPTSRFAVNEQKKSLNQIRSYRFEERIDYFLFELKCWYAKENKVSASKNVLDGNKDWFNQFEKNFEGFIDYFCMNDFVDDKYNVYNLASYKDRNFSEIITEQPNIDYRCNNYPKALQDAYIPVNYINYIRGCTYAIQCRTKRMREIHI